MFFWSITLISIEKEKEKERTKFSVQFNNCGNSLERRKKSKLFSRGKRK
jgi:hypothetical protein